MVKKATTPAAEAPAADVSATPAAKKPATKKPDGCAAGFYCYIGPSISGVIRNGAIFKGTRADALSVAAAAIEKQPLVKTLIVSGDDLPEARLQVKKPGNALHAMYQRVAGKK